MIRMPTPSTALRLVGLGLWVVLLSVPGLASAQRAMPPHVRPMPILGPRHLAPRRLQPSPPHRPAPPAAHGRLSCRILENGAPASGTLVVRQGDTQVATGSCGAPLTLPAGQYTAVLRLDGALDQPEQQRPVTVRGNQSAQVQADFPTGILEVMISANGRRAAGLATIMQGGRRVGTLGSGVPAHLSADTYTVLVRYRTTEKRFTGISLSRGQRRAIEASF